MLQKLENIEIRGKLLIWISAFLKHRLMYVSVAGAKSEQKQVRSGVTSNPRIGSWPSTFSDLSTTLNNCKIFADDLKIYLRYNSVSALSMASGVSLCQKDIDTISSVVETWGLNLNRGKCVVMQY